MTWYTGHTGNKNDKKKRRVLMEIFERNYYSRSSGAKNRSIFTMMEQHVQSEGVVNLEGMG